MNYEPILQSCLGDEAETFHIADVVSATERATTLRLERRGNEEYFAFKFVEPSGPEDASFPYRLATMENEIAVLGQLQDYTHDLFVAGNSALERAWVMTRWLAGPSAIGEARRMRQNAATEELLALIVQIFESVASLHEYGYTHGDIQPMHFTYDSDRLALVDFGLARRIDGTGLPYRGALVHFAAPEVAEGMRNDAEDIPYDVLSEIYSVASTAFLLYTGKTTTDYGETPEGRPSFEAMLERIATGAGRRTFASAEAPPFPALEAVLERCLSLDRAARFPSLRAATDTLKAILPDG